MPHSLDLPLLACLSAQSCTPSSPSAARHLSSPPTKSNSSVEQEANKGSDVVVAVKEIASIYPPRALVAVISVRPSDPGSSEQCGLTDS